MLENKLSTSFKQKRLESFVNNDRHADLSKKWHANLTFCIFFVPGLYHYVTEEELQNYTKTLSTQRC